MIVAGDGGEAFGDGLRHDARKPMEKGLGSRMFAGQLAVFVGTAPEWIWLYRIFGEKVFMQVRSRMFVINKK